MSGQSKGGYGQSYSQPYGSSYGQNYGYGYPGQQGSFFSTGGSSRPYQTQPYQIPDSGIPRGVQNPLMMDAGSLFGSQFPGSGYYGPQGPSGYSPAGSQGMSGSPIARGGQLPGNGGFPNTGGQSSGYNGYTGLSSQGTTAAQQGMGIGTTPQGTLSFSPSGNLNQISSATASLMGARNNGQGQWVNAQGQVIGLV